MCKTIRLSIFLMFVAGFFSGLPQQILAQETRGGAAGTILSDRSDYHTPGINPFLTPSELLNDDSVFNTTVFTFGEVVLFSYTDNTEISVVNSSVDEVFSVTLNEDEYE